MSEQPSGPTRPTRWLVGSLARRSVAKTPLIIPAGSESGLNVAVSTCVPYIRSKNGPSPVSAHCIDLLEFSCMCARRAQSACHQSMGTGICILSQFSEFRIQNMHSTLYVYFQSIFRNMLPHILMHVSENRLKIHI